MNPLVSVSWKGLRKPAGSLRNLGRRRCSLVFTSWEFSAPGIRVLLFVHGGQSPEDGDLPQKCAERFLKKLSELEIQAEEWKIVPWVWENFCNISDLFTLFGLKFWKVGSFTRERKLASGILSLGPEFSVHGSTGSSKVIVPFRFFLPSTYKARMRIVMTAGGTMGTKWRVQNEAELKHHRSWKLIHRDNCSCPEEVCCQLTSTAWTTVASRPSRSGS